MQDYDLTVIGGGAAGLAAGIYGVRSGLHTLVLDDRMAGGTTADAPVVDNYPGFVHVTGQELAQKMIDHARNQGAMINSLETAMSLQLEGEMKNVRTDKGTYQTKAIVIATGAYYKQLGIPGEKEFRGRGVSYCGICDGPLFKGKKVLVVGGGNSALITSLYLSGIASEVKIAHRRDKFRAEEAYIKDLGTKSNVKVYWDSEVKEIAGEKLVNKVKLANNKTGETSELAVDGVFVQIGEAPNSQIFKEAGVEVDVNGYIIVDMLQHTNIRGVFAAGDITNHPVKQIGTAVGQGITAALEAYAHIKRPYYHR